MPPLLLTLSYTGGIHGHNRYLTLEEDVVQLGRLRRRIEGDLAAAGETLPEDTWNLLLTLRHYVHSKLHHDSYRPAGRRDAMYLLDQAEAGTSFRCVEHGMLLCQVYQAFGIPARDLSLQLPEPNLIFGAGHVLCEAWWEEAGQWVVMDSELDAHWEVGGRPLSGLEAHNLVVTGRADEMAWVFGGPVPEDLRIPGAARWWARYFTHVMPGRNVAFMTNPVATPGAPGPVLYADPRVPPQFQFQGLPQRLELESDPAALWFDCNRVAIHVTKVEHLDGERVRLHLRYAHSAPWLDRFEVRASGQYEDHGDGTAVWTLDEVNPRLEVRTINKMGRKGQSAALIFLLAPAAVIAGQ